MSSPNGGVCKLLTLRQFKDALDGAIGENTLRKALKDGRIKHMTVGRAKVLIPSTELEAWPEREAIGGEK